MFKSTVGTIEVAQEIKDDNLMKMLAEQIQDEIFEQNWTEKHVEYLSSEFVMDGISWSVGVKEVYASGWEGDKYQDREMVVELLLYLDKTTQRETGIYFRQQQTRTGSYYTDWKYMNYTPERVIKMKKVVAVEEWFSKNDLTDLPNGDRIIEEVGM